MLSPGTIDAVKLAVSGTGAPGAGAAVAADIAKAAAAAAAVTTTAAVTSRAERQMSRGSEQSGQSDIDGRSVDIEEQRPINIRRPKQVHIQEEGEEARPLRRDNSGGVSSFQSTTPQAECSTPGAQTSGEEDSGDDDDQDGHNYGPDYGDDDEEHESIRETAL